MFAAILSLLLAIAPDRAAETSPPPQSSQPLVSTAATLRMGRTLLVRVENREQVVQSEAAATADRPWTVQDAVSLGALIGPSAQDTLRGANPASTPTLPRDGVRFTLVNPMGRHIMLIIDNGSAQRVRYTAEMALSDGRVVHTNVCDAPGGHTFYEHWTDPIVALHIRVEEAFAEPGGAPYCEPPTSGRNQEGGLTNT